MSSSGQITEEEVLKWLLKMGCKLPDGRSITKGSLAALTKANMQPFWEKMLYCVKPVPVAEKVRTVTAKFREAETGVTDEKGLLQIRQRRELKASLREKEARLKELRAAWQQQQTQINFQMTEVLETEVQQAQTRQETNDHGFQSVVLAACRQRSKSLLPLLQTWWRELQKVAQLARMRCELLQAAANHASSPPQTTGSYGMVELDEVDLQVSQAINQVKTILQSMIAPHLDPTPGPSPSLTSNQALLSTNPSAPGLPSFVGSLPPNSPKAAPSPSQEGGDIDLHEAAANPDIQAQVMQLIGQPPALVLKALAAMAEQEQNQVRQQLISGDIWSFAQEVGLLADFQAAKDSPSTNSIMQEKQKEHVKCFLEKQEAEAATQEARAELERLKSHPLWEVAMSKEVNQLVLQESKLKAEVSQLWSVIQQLTAELERLNENEAAARAVYVRTQSYMSRERHLNTVMNKLIRQNVNLSSSWVERQSQAQHTVLGTLSLLEEAVNLTSKVHHALTKEVEAGMKLPLHLLTPAALTSKTGSSQPLVLQRQQSALTAIAGSDKPASRSPSTAPANPDVTFAAVLKASSKLDPCAPLKCPAGLIMALAERGAQIEASQTLISNSVPKSTVYQQQLEATQQEVVQLELSQKAWLDEVEKSLVPRLQQTLMLNKESMWYAANSVQTAMRDWWEQPAMHLVPWRKHMGLSCTEWLAKVQALHMELKQGRPAQ